MKYIGIDLGSNSLRAVKMEYEANTQRLTTLGMFEATVRTAEGLEQSGEISKEALHRIIENLLILRKTLAITPKDTIIALTTQAMRKAKNQKEILEILLKETGISFQVIDGITEAQITALAPKIALKGFKNNPKYAKECFLLIDMGGASSEFIVCKDSKDLAKSFEIGIVSAKERYKSIENLLVHKEEILNPIQAFLQECKECGAIPRFVVANSGTPTIVCAIKLGLEVYDSKRIFGQELSLQDFFEVLNTFSSWSEEQQIERVGAFKSDVVPFGIALFTAFMESLGFTECLVIDEGLREGAIIGRIQGLI